MSDTGARVLEAVQAEDAKQILRALHDRGGEVARAVEEEVDRIYGGADDAEEIASDALARLESIDVEDLWDRSGKRADGTYVEPAEESYVMLREAIAPYVARMEDHLEDGDLEEADAMLRGVALGLYRFSRQSSTTFRDWARDDPSIVLEEALRRWRGRRGGSAARRETEEWLRERLPEWEWVRSES